MFVDRVTVFVKGGDGGAGCCSFRREKYVPKGGPDGGDGGDGGDVIVRAVAGTDSLAEIVNRKHWRAEAGGRGGPDNCHGRRAAELVIPVPPGTLVYDRERGNLLRDLKEAGEQVTAAHGGRGGRGNKAFATAINRALRETQPGTEGEERWIVLELKVIADAGLIGLPNAGKSTLLSRLSQAQPRHRRLSVHDQTPQSRLGDHWRRTRFRAGRSARTHRRSASRCRFGTRVFAPRRTDARPCASGRTGAGGWQRSAAELSDYSPRIGIAWPCFGGQAGDCGGEQSGVDRQRGSAAAIGRGVGRVRCWRCRR